MENLPFVKALLLTLVFILYGSYVIENTIMILNIKVLNKYFSHYSSTFYTFYLFYLFV